MRPFILSLALIGISLTSQADAASVTWTLCYPSPGTFELGDVKLQMRQW